MNGRIAMLFLLGIMWLVSCTKDDDLTKDDETQTIKDDRDNQEYKIVKIGDQTWMAENLKYVSTESICYDDDDNCDKYGRLYNYEDALTVCPEGYELPTDDDWKTLELQIGMTQEEVDAYGNRGSKAGGIKPGGSTGFDVQYGGGYFVTLSAYIGKDISSTMQCADTTSDGDVKTRTVSPNQSYIHRNEGISYKQSNYFCVRCLKSE